MRKLFVVVLVCFIKSTLFAQTIQSVTPNTGYTGDVNLQVTLSGLNTNFSQGSSTIEFSQGSSTYFYGYATQVNSATQLATYIDIPCYSPNGLYNVSVTNNNATVSGANVFTVNSPSIQSVTPDSAYPGEVLNVQVAGLNTDFSQGSNTYAYVQFFNSASSTYINGYNYDINSPTQLTASITIPCSPGVYDVWMDENGCLLTLDNAFNVLTPSIQSVTPDSGSEGGGLSVQIAGLNTDFSQGSNTYVQFEQGTTTYFTGFNTLVSNQTQLSTSINIPCTSYPGLYNVLVGESGCLVTLDSAFTVTPGSCSSLSVWPGDANEDLVVNNYDLLPIGLYYGDTGTARDTTTIVWAPHPATDWDSLQADGFNRKFVDCNGDGVINSNDTLAITQNYGFNHPFDGPRQSVERTSGTVPLSITTDSSFYHAGSTVHATVSLGTSTNMASNMYGLAYDISLNTYLVVSNSTSFNYNNTSFLGTKNVNALVMTKLNNDIETVVTGIDHTNKSGYGNIGDLYFTVNSDVSSLQLRLSISNYEAIDAQGNELGLTTGISQLPLNSNQLSIYPNPTRGELTIISEKNIDDLKVTNVLGQLIYEAKPNQTQLKFEIKFAGMYFITITSNNETTTNKILVVK